MDFHVLGIKSYHITGLVHNFGGDGCLTQVQPVKRAGCLSVLLHQFGTGNRRPLVAVLNSYARFFQGVAYGHHFIISFRECDLQRRKQAFPIQMVSFYKNLALGVKNKDVNGIHIFPQMFLIVISQIGKDNRVAKTAAQIVIYPVAGGHEV